MRWMGGRTEGQRDGGIREMDGRMDGGTERWDRLMDGPTNVVGDGEKGTALSKK